MSKVKSNFIKVDHIPCEENASGRREKKRREEKKKEKKKKKKRREREEEEEEKKKKKRREEKKKRREEEEEKYVVRVGLFLLKTRKCSSSHLVKKPLVFHDPRISSSFL
ncbi:Hypothetical predicted protein [Scomber scombrus]|uniref:Uncharacterized protein n=1 Tax=Scomber scombrus TaxID=13677 RepID=A0AAV1Q187_SCOSC